MSCPNESNGVCTMNLEKCGGFCLTHWAFCPFNSGFEEGGDEWAYDMRI